MSGKHHRPDRVAPPADSLKGPGSRGQVPPTTRHRAEQIAREAAARSAEDSRAMSPEEARRTLYELRVHQIEVDILREELHRTEADLDAARARYFDLFDHAPSAHCTLGEHGLILEANLAAAAMLGLPRRALIEQPISWFVAREDREICDLHLGRLFATGEPQAFELRMVKKDGTRLWARLEASVAGGANGARRCRVTVSDITDRKLRDDERELIERLIVLVNAPGDFRDRMASLTASLQSWSGCEAVGIRLRAGEDFPYYETRGFPPAFVRQESRLCVYGPDGKVLHNGVGNPVLECMCGNVLCGRVDPAKPYFTTHGSYWSNNTTLLLAGTTEGDREARTRNRCNGEGYESVALIPLRVGHQVFGLLQFNDHRPDRFTRRMIEHFERMSDSLAIALARRRLEEALRESEANLRLDQEIARMGHWELDVATNHLAWSAGIFSLLETDREALIPSCEAFLGLVHPEDRALVSRAFQESVERGAPYEVEHRLLLPDGRVKWVIEIGRFEYGDGGRPVRCRGILQDVTQRKRAETVRETGRED